MGVPLVRPVAIVSPAVPWLATETTPCCSKPAFFTPAQRRTRYMRQAGSPLIREQRGSCSGEDGGNHSVQDSKDYSGHCGTGGDRELFQGSEGLISSINTAKDSLSWSRLRAVSARRNRH